MSGLLVSSQPFINGIQIIGAVSAVGGGVVAVAQAILGQDYTYSCTVMALGAWTWLSVSIGGCAQKKSEENVPSSDKPVYNQESLNKTIDALAEVSKEKLKVGTASLVDSSVVGAKAVLTTLTPSYAPIAAPLIDSAGTSAKGISNILIDSSVDSAGQSAKKSAQWSFEKK